MQAEANTMQACNAGSGTETSFARASLCEDVHNASPGREEEGTTHEEGGRILALVSLQLDDLAQLRVVHHRTVAAELCAEGTEPSRHVAARVACTRSGY
jgi:hypothetical protein